MRWCSTLMVVLGLFVASGCRDLIATDGTRFSDNHILAGRSPAFITAPERPFGDEFRRPIWEGAFVSPSSALLPLQSWMRASLGGSFSLRSTREDRGLLPDAEGTVLRLVLSRPGVATLRAAPSALGGDWYSAGAADGGTFVLGLLFLVMFVLTISEADAVHVDLGALAEGSPIALAGNLPYAVTAATLKNMVAHRAAIRSAGSFHPPPKVDSAVVRLDALCPPRAVEDDAFRAVVRAAFGQRRKTLRNSLSALEGAEAALAACGIDASRRAETLSVEELAAVAGALPS